MPSYRYLFGPVPSRRLGRSLGVDLVPSKTCNCDCVFCQIGRTPATTVVRQEYVETKAVLDELQRWLDADGHADFITLAGGGEPTLHSRFGEVIDAVASRCRIPCALLSNGALFTHEVVRRDASRADVVKVSLSAWDQPSFEAVNRPHAGTRFADVVDGLRQFRAVFSGCLWVEVFVVPGLNDSVGHMQRIAARVSELAPDHVHLNTAVRPSAEPSVRPAPRACLQRLSVLFDPVAEIAVSRDIDAVGAKVGCADEQDIVAMVARHPATAEGIQDAFGLTGEESLRMLATLCNQGRIRAERRGDSVYYVSVSTDRDGSTFHAKDRA